MLADPPVAVRHRGAAHAVLGVGAGRGPEGQGGCAVLAAARVRRGGRTPLATPEVVGGEAGERLEASLDPGEEGSAIFAGGVRSWAQSATGHRDLEVSLAVEERGQLPRGGGDSQLLGPEPNLLPHARQGSGGDRRLALRQPLAKRPR